MTTEARKPHWLDSSETAIRQQLRAWGQPAYRLSQLRTAFRQNPGLSPDAWTVSTWPKHLRTEAAHVWRWHWAGVDDVLVDAEDATRKWVFRLADGCRIESVMIPDGRRRTLCLSSQAGCAMGCSFCATGDQGLTRNLTVGEIVGQWLYVDACLRREGEPGLSNGVFMGMGEPLHNFGNLRRALAWLTDPEGAGVSPSRLTVSTVGLREPLQALILETNVHVAVSLHAAHADVRETIVPAERGQRAQDLQHLLRTYADCFRNRRKLTIEVTLLAGVNDTVADARALADWLDGIPAHVNLIPFNPHPGARHARPQQQRIEAFQNTLTAQGTTAWIRRTRGQKIAAACGTLNTASRMEQCA